MTFSSLGRRDVGSPLGTSRGHVVRQDPAQALLRGGRASAVEEGNRGSHLALVRASPPLGVTPVGGQSPGSTSICDRVGTARAGLALTSFLRRESLVALLLDLGWALGGRRCRVLRGLAISSCVSCLLASLS